MMSAPVGSTLKVSGNSMAMVAIGPMPGSTPIKVPTRHPMKASRRLTGDNAVAKPSPRLPIKSNMNTSSITHQPWREWNRQAQRKLEQADANSSHQYAHHDRIDPANLLARKGGSDDGNRSGHNQSQRAYGQAKCHNGEGDQNGTANGPSLKRRARFKDGAQDEKRTKQPEQHCQGLGQHSRAHPSQCSDRQIGGLPEGK